MAFEKNCGPCYGSGYYGISPRETCQVCLGIGVNKVAGIASDYKICGPCYGSGYYGISPRETCQVCLGIGVNKVAGKGSDYKTCGPCNGSGHYGISPKETCQVCQGLGLVSVQPIIESPMPEPKAVSSPTRESNVTGTVFLVHGRNHAVRDQIDIFLTKELNLKVQVMAAEPNQGRTLPEKFEEIASDCKFAVFLLTADDVLTTQDNKTVRRARQNVILEVGYFWGALGRRGRIVFLVENHPEMDLPTDIQGLGWIPITPDLGDTKLRLRQELQAAGLVM